MRNLFFGMLACVLFTSAAQAQTVGKHNILEVITQVNKAPPAHFTKLEHIRLPEDEIIPASVRSMGKYDLRGFHAEFDRDGVEYSVTFNWDIGGLYLTMTSPGEGGRVQEESIGDMSSVPRGVVSVGMLGTEKNVHYYFDTILETGDGSEKITKEEHERRRAYYQKHLDFALDAMLETAYGR